jgi:hypothetical protein
MRVRDGDIIAIDHRDWRDEQIEKLGNRATAKEKSRIKSVVSETFQQKI